jgi:hypothetical protein
LIRETMQRRLLELKARDCRDRFASITGLVNSKETNLSQRVDEILYGGPARKCISKLSRPVSSRLHRR